MQAAPGRIAFAQALRGLAAFSVLLSHYTEHFWHQPAVAAAFLSAPVWEGPVPGMVRPHEWLPYGFAGHFGVAVFFLVSGFVVPLSLLDRTRVGFAAGRALRIWPTYAVGLGLTMAAVWACAHWFGRAVPFGPELWLAHLLFAQDLLGRGTIDGVSWTLAIEVRFYLLCLLLAPALRAGTVWPLSAAGVVLVAVTAPLAGLVAPPWRAAAGELAVSATMISFMLVGAVFAARHRGTAGPGACLAAAALLLATFFRGWAGGEMAAQTVPGMIAYGAALILFAVLFGLRGRIRRIPGPLEALARISYPLYVVHAMAGYAVIRVLLDLGWSAAAAVLAAAAAAFAAATLLHLLVEAPTQALAHRLGRVPRPVSPGAP
ncbi:acyltransferase family protein [Muricoccus radiodurans]|uniref:acyltransferase family protein n=1 Tax=Muricoccus radiodurans TaxID=2231721 RepID=UPI003CF73273